jgi:hypothetical protein
MPPRLGLDSFQVRVMMYFEALIRSYLGQLCRRASHAGLHQSGRRRAKYKP